MHVFAHWCVFHQQKKSVHILESTLNARGCSLVFLSPAKKVRAYLGIYFRRTCYCSLVCLSPAKKVRAYLGVSLIGAYLGFPLTWAYFCFTHASPLNTRWWDLHSRLYSLSHCTYSYFLTISVYIGSAQRKLFSFWPKNLLGAFWGFAFLLPVISPSVHPIVIN